MKEKVDIMIGTGSNSRIIDNNKGEIAMVGSGETAIFVEAGISPKEEMEEVNKYFDNMIEENKKEKTKVLGLINKKDF